MQSVFRRGFNRYFLLICTLLAVSINFNLFSIIQSIRYCSLLFVLNFRKLRVSSQQCIFPPYLHQGSPILLMQSDARLQSIQNWAMEVVWVHACMHKTAFVKAVHVCNHPLPSPATSYGLLSQKSWGPLIYTILPCAEMLHRLRAP